MSIKLKIHAFECIQSIQTIIKEDQLTPRTSSNNSIDDDDDLLAKEKEQLKIPLIKNKPGIIRVYFADNHADKSVIIRGTLNVLLNDSVKEQNIESANSVIFKPNPDIVIPKEVRKRNNQTELKTKKHNLRKKRDVDYIDFQRYDINNALYFDLKEVFLSGSDSKSNSDEADDKLVITSLEVKGIFQDQGDVVDIQVQDYPPVEDLTYTFKPEPNLKLDVLNYRYYSEQDDEIYYANENSLDMMQSYINRMFPSATVDWGTRIIDAPAGFGPPFENFPNTLPDLVWQRKLNLLHAHTSMVRLIELEYFEQGLLDPASGIVLDPESESELTDEERIRNNFRQKLRGRYYGIINDPEDVFEGAASFVPELDKHNSRNNLPSRPDCVAAGIAEEYSGYYGAHEIAHTFGSLHHGVGDGQEEENREFKKIYYDQGKISTKSMQHIGLDYGDSKFPKMIYPWKSTFDIMSYEDNLWISSYTYKEILQALQNDVKTSKMLEELITEETKNHYSDLDNINPKQNNNEQGKNSNYLPQEKYVSVIGSYDFTEHAGKFLYVQPTKQQALSRNFSDVSESHRDRFNKVILIARYGSGYAYDPLANTMEVKVQIKRQDHMDLPQATGIFQTTVNRFYTTFDKDENGDQIETVEFSKELKSIELYVDESKPAVYRFLMENDVERELPFEPSNHRKDKKVYRIGVKSGPDENLDYFLIFYFNNYKVEERRHNVPIMDHRNFSYAKKMVNLDDSTVRNPEVKLKLDKINEFLESIGPTQAKYITLTHKSKYQLLVRPLIGPQYWQVASLDVQPDFGVYLDKQQFTIPRFEDEYLKNKNTTSASIKNPQFMYDVIAFQFRLIKVDGLHRKDMFDIKKWDDNVVIQNPKYPKKFDISSKDKNNIMNKIKHMHTRKHQINYLYKKLEPYLNPGVKNDT